MGATHDTAELRGRDPYPALPGLDLPRLSGYLAEFLPGRIAGPLTAHRVPGGRSNLTYLLSDGEQTWVLRRPPIGHVLETARGIAREYRVMKGLRGGGVPVPAMVLRCPDLAVVGAPFYVMSYIAGTVFRTAEQLSGLTGEAAARTAEGLVDVLVRLHATDVAGAGLADLGRPEGYLERQVRRWGKQLEASRSRDLPDVAKLVQRLGVLVNVVMDAVQPGRVRAVLDWEMATLGDPTTDLANLVIWWDGVRDAQGETFSAAPADVQGFPDSAALVETLPWFLGLAYFKLAAIFEGMYYRGSRGLTVGDGFDRLAGLAPALAHRGHAALDGNLARITQPEAR